MKILLKKDIRKLGKIGDVVDVANGYARNYLLPKKFATDINPGNIEQLSIKRKKQEEIYREEIQNLQVIANNISKATCAITVKTNKEGKLFGSVLAQHIAEALCEKGFRVDENMVSLESPIKKCGEYKVSVALHPEVKSECSVHVVSETEDSAILQEESVELPAQSNSGKKKE
ncbi:MAG: 50S ribosomal protein L9 [Candidatus Scalindua sp.]|nr:50S ribosomal protein L9 [Candidatus Scalindua sp.]